MCQKYDVLIVYSVSTLTTSTSTTNMISNPHPTDMAADSLNIDV